MPRISNFTDFNPLEYLDGVSLRYVGSVSDLGDPDLIILPGTKNTMGDLEFLRQSGLEARILQHAAKGKPVIGICGGYQMLGLSLSDPHGVEHGGQMAGLGLLPFSTVFAENKTRTRVTGQVPEVGGIFARISGLTYEGYEIHMGVTDAEGMVVNHGNVYGTYLHGFFDREEITKAVAEALFAAKGLDASEIRAFDIAAYKEEQYDKLADALRASLDMEKIYQILNEGVQA